MPEDGIGAVAEAIESPVNTEIDGGESTSATGTDGESVTRESAEKSDARRNPDALRKHIADLRRQADSIVDPAEKKAALDRIKMLYDTTGKARGYEEQFPTVREAREVKALLDAVGGREGFQQMQAALSEVEQIDQQLAAGDASVIDRMWQEAPEGMPKLVPAILDRFAKEKPQEYAQFLAPKAVGFLDQSGFPQAFDRMVQLYEGGKTEDAQAIRDQLIQWVLGNRQQGQQTKQTDPEMERLRQENEKLRQGDESKQVDTAYNAVVSHAGPAIDAAAKPLIGKLGFNKEENGAFRQAVWDHLQTARNNDSTYQTVAPAKQRQGYDKWIEYANRWTRDNAETSVRAVLKTPPWSRLQSAKPALVTKAPGAVTVQTGKEPAASEIDYSGKGLQAAHKAGFRNLQDMLLSGQAPLKAGGIRKWR